MYPTTPYDSYQPTYNLGLSQNASVAFKTYSSS